MAEELPEHLQKRVLVYIGGGLLPSQADDAGPCVPLQPLAYVDAHAQTLRIDFLPKIPPPLPAGVQQHAVWPFRFSHAHLAPALSVGTVDELVADFRDKLIRAVKCMAEGPLPYENNEAALSNAQVHGYVSGRAVSVPFYRLGDTVTQKWVTWAADMTQRLEQDKSDGVVPSLLVTAHEEAAKPSRAESANPGAGKDPGAAAATK